MKHFTDDQLEASADRARSRERVALHEMLVHLREIDRRKLFSKRGYPSIYDYAMARFKYSYDEIHRRFTATKVLKEMPEIESKIIDGSLQLTHLTQAQSYFKKAQHTRGEKLEILAKLENKSKAETIKILYHKEVNARYYFEAHKEFEEKVERLKGLQPHLSFDQLMEKVFDIALEKLDPMAKAVRIQAKEAAREKSWKASEVTEEVVASSAVHSQQVRRASAKTQRYIQASVKRDVWTKAQGKCQHCGSTFALEYDHIVPFAKGGASTTENLRLLCRSCNQRRGIEEFGLTKMRLFESRSLQPKEMPTY